MFKYRYITYPIKYLYIFNQGEREFNTNPSDNDELRVIK